MALSDFLSDFFRKFVKIMGQNLIINVRFPCDIARVFNATALFAVPGNAFDINI
jgi:hypothetical protein